MTEIDAINGEAAGYVPCGEESAALPALDEDDEAIAGQAAGYVAANQGAATGPVPDESRAISGTAGAFLPAPCNCDCGRLPGSSGLVDSGSAPTGTLDVVQSTAGTLEDAFGRIIPYIYPPTPGPVGQWDQWGLADTGQQWWNSSGGGSQLPPPPNSYELDGATVLVTDNHGDQTGPVVSLSVNAPTTGGYDYRYWDFGWVLCDAGFDVTFDVFFDRYLFTAPTGAAITFTMSVHVGAPDQLSHSRASVIFQQKRSTDALLMFLTRGGDPPASRTLPALSSSSWYRIRWQVDGPLCGSRAKIWLVGTTEPTDWDLETTLLAPMMANGSFLAGVASVGNIVGGPPRLLKGDNVNLSPRNLYGHATVTEDDVAQIGPRQYQLKNSYLPSTISAFVERTGYPLQKYSRFQVSPNILEDDPIAGIFSFPASINYTPAYNPTITTGTTVSASYVVPPAC